ncbi:MAG: LytR C-terminal domain-containing protein [Micromonosporaceae bacterium]|nr:LytR C-terminal domain-containing protein [Micromonosporaceae bacterium]
MSLARIRSLVLLSVLVLCAIILVGVAVARDKQTRTDYGGKECPAGLVPIATRPLPDESKIKINILNGNGAPGLGSQIASELHNRGFSVSPPKDTKRYAKVARVTYGPKTVAAATVVDAYFLGDADMQFDIKRTNDVIDVTIGRKFVSLGTPTDVHQAIAALGNPSPPPGTCDISP